MSKLDIGTLVAMVVGSVGPVLVWARAWLARGLDALRGSFVAMVSSPAVWLASICVGFIAYFGGFWLGHRAGSADVPALTAKVSALQQDAIRIRAERDTARAEAETARAPREAPASAAPAAPGASVAASTPRPVVRRPAKLTAPSEPAKPFRPFD